MDGNGRWAREQGLPRTAGHREGMKRVKEIVRQAAERGIKALTLFAFSTENWSRPRGEIAMLMRSLEAFLDREIAELSRKNIRFITIGRDEPLPARVLRSIRNAEELTRGNTGMMLILALNYGGRQEIVDAARALAREAQAARVRPEDIDEAAFAGFLYTRGLPEPDLLIRTSGEMRISNFLLWQLSYAELYFPKVHWPAFTVKEFEKALSTYRRRERRFGGIRAAA